MSKKLLSKDEVVVRHMHTHIKVLLWRIVAVVVLLAAAIVGSVFVPADSRKWALPAIWIVFVVVAIPLFVIPWLKWLSATYTVTTKRIITRSGIFHGARPAAQSYLGHSDGQGSERSPVRMWNAGLADLGR